MKTRTELFREAKDGKITLELVERFGKRDLPPRFTEKRKIGKVQSNGMYLVNSEGEESFLELPRASMMEYDGKELRVYNPGYREMTNQEKAVMEEWNQIQNTDDYKERAKADLYSDGSGTYYQEKQFFMGKGMEHLTGNMHKGAKLDFFKYSNGETECILDERVKGRVILLYKVGKVG